MSMDERKTQADIYIEDLKALPSKVKRAAEDTYASAKDTVRAVREDPRGENIKAAEKVGNALDKLAGGKREEDEKRAAKEEKKRAAKEDEGEEEEEVEAAPKEKKPKGAVDIIKEKITAERGDSGLHAIGKNAPMFRKGTFATDFGRNFSQRTDSRYAPSRGKYGMSTSPISFGSRMTTQQPVYVARQAAQKPTPQRQAPQRPANIPNGRLVMKYNTSVIKRQAPTNTKKDQPNVFASNFKLDLFKKRGR